MKFKKDVDPIPMTEDFWYMLTAKGNIHLHEILENQDDIDEVQKAIDILEEFESKCFDEGIFEEC